MSQLVWAEQLRPVCTYLLGGKCLHKVYLGTDMDTFLHCKNEWGFEFLATLLISS